MSASVAEADFAVDAASNCRHCGLPCAAGQGFCCIGCSAAFLTIGQLGLGDYYGRRLLDTAKRAPRPEPTERFDLQDCVVTRNDGTCEMTLTVDGVQCGACVWLIEQVLHRSPGVRQARVNMTTCRLRVVWSELETTAFRLVDSIERLGYRLVPFQPGRQQSASDAIERSLIRALAVAGFAAGNVMLLSIAVWSGLDAGMGPATRTLLHWISALLAMPAIAYAGMPFFRPAWAALRHRRTNMDVPISVGVILVTTMSLVETIRGGTDTYFDSAITLLFFLLIGRLLDHRARGLARAAAERLLALRDADVAVLEPDGTLRRRAAVAVAAGAFVVAALGERIGVDGIVTAGAGLLDTRLITGESLPRPAGISTEVFAGMVNLGSALTIRVTATGSGTLVAEMARLIEAAESRRGRFVVLADRVARRYAPAVHGCALLAFLWWAVVRQVPVGQALLVACAVLIITCPCALALAVPTAQTIAAGRLFAGGILLKSATALERLATIDTVVFDKTGTLSEPELALTGPSDPDAIAVAASLAASSRHPLARALLATVGPVVPRLGAVEHPGEGISLASYEGEIRLGSRHFCGVETIGEGSAELWLARPGQAQTRFAFTEVWRPDAAGTIAALSAMGMQVHLLSGDRSEPVRRAALALGIAHWHAGCLPTDKVARVEAMRRAGRHVLMVGDGLNDAPCLAAADASISPATGAQISQTVADLVFQGASLAPVAKALDTARRTRRVMRQNLILAIGYNAVALPFAACGYVTPWLAAVSMSLSSLLVIGNSLRLRGREPR